jgi:hypothetical protein
MHFDHTSIVKTILTRFCQKNAQIPVPPARVAAAQHLQEDLAEMPLDGSVGPAICLHRTGRRAQR